MKGIKDIRHDGTRKVKIAQCQGDGEIGEAVKPDIFSE